MPILELRFRIYTRTVILILILSLLFGCSRPTQDGPDATTALSAAPTHTPTATPTTELSTPTPPEAVMEAKQEPEAKPTLSATPKHVKEADTMAEANRTLIFVGTYTRRESEGIYVYELDAETGALSHLATATDVENPSFLAIHPSKPVVYAVNEVGAWQGESTGAVSAFALDPDTGELTLLNQHPTHGTAPCHVTVNREGTFAYVANYGSGTASVFPLQEDGSLEPASDTVVFEGSGPNPQRQQEPHAHSVTLDAANRFAFIADLGTDRLMSYRIDEVPSELIPNKVPFYKEAGGSGPRHFTFHPNGRYAYLINEMGNTITALAYDPVSGTMERLQTVPTLPEDFEGSNTTADIHVTPSGRFLYGSNRGHNSVVVYAIDETTGTLEYVEHTSTGGKTPRNFGIDPSGTLLLVANQDSDNVVAFKIDDETGKLTPTGEETEVSMPVCVKFLVP
jgi:6-phosphogluconolactonase